MSTPVQSPAAYTPGTEVRDTRSTSMKPRSSTFTPAASRPQPSVRGTMPTVIRQWLPVTVRPSARVTVTLSRSRLTALRPGPAEHRHAAAAEHVLDQVGRVLVLLRQHPVPGGHQRDPRAERLVGAGELGPGDAGADHDQVPGQLGQVVELPPGQDALAVGFGAGEHAGQRAGGDQDRVGLDLLRHRPRTLPGPSRRPCSGDHPDVLGGDPGGDVAGLGPGQVGDPLVQPHGVDRVQAAAGDAEAGAPVEQRHRVGGLDQGLGGHAVGEHAGAAEPVRIDDGDVGAELGGDEGGLVAAGAAAEDRDSLAWQGHGG